MSLETSIDDELKKSAEAPVLIEEFGCFPNEPHGLHNHWSVYKVGTEVIRIWHETGATTNVTESYYPIPDNIILGEN